jgi:hypothetical protein
MRLGGQELLPGRSSPPRCGINTGVMQDLPDSTGRNPVAEADQFAVDGESAWGAVTGFLRFRFPRPLSEPGVRLSPHRALHGIMSLV